MDYFHKTLEDFSNEHRVQRLVAVTQKGENNTIIGFWEGVAVVDVEKNVKDVIVPEKFRDLDIVSISSDIFNGTGIEKLKVSKNVTIIDAQGASNATELKEITVDSANTVYASAAGVLFTKDYSEIFTLSNEKYVETVYDTKRNNIFRYKTDIYQSLFGKYICRKRK